MLHSICVASDEATAGSVIANAERILPSSRGLSQRSFCSAVPRWGPARAPPLAAVGHVAAAVAPGAALDRRRIRRGDRGLGDRARRAGLAVEQGLEPAALLLRGAGALEHLHVAGVRDHGP